MSLWQRLKDNAGERLRKFDEQTQRYRRDEVTLPEQALMGGSQAVGMLADVPAEVAMTGLSAITPDVIKTGLRHLMSGVVNSAPAQAAIKLAQENPRAARNLGYTGELLLELVGGGVAQRAPKELIDSAARNAPNKLEGFYGSGTGGQVGAVTKGGPTTAGHMLHELVSPRAQARVEAGVSPRLRSVARNEQDMSFLEGQMDQSNLLGIGGGKENPALQQIFGDIQNLHVGDMDTGTFKKAFEVYKPSQYDNFKVDDELVSNMLQEVKRIGDVEDARVVIRHPTALTDLYPESTTRGSRSARRMYKARQLEQKYNPGKTKFDNTEDMKEFVATRFLVDDTMVKKTPEGPQAMTRADRLRERAIGPGETYGPRESGMARIEQYYRYKNADKLSKPQQKIYDELKDRVDKAKDRVRIGDDGRAYFTASHRSAAKGLGGVGDVFSVDAEGNVMHFMVDENDLFGVTVPGDSRVFTITPPTVYNVFETTGKAKADVESAARKKALAERTEAIYGAPQRGTSRDALRGQMGEAILNVNPPVQPRHIVAPAATGGLLTGAGVGLANDER